MINFKNIALAFFVLYLANCDAVTDYYWRDYSGAIPCDAVKGGTDAAGNTTYIGQVSAADKCADTQPDIISSTIHEGNKTAYAAYHSAIYYQTKHVKILCSNNLQNVIWSKKFETGCELIRGSYTKPYDNYYIGRTAYNGEVVTGRFSTKAGALWIPWKTKLVSTKTFEMLQVCNRGC